MCGRYALTLTPAELKQIFHTKNDCPFQINTNITPQTDVPVVVYSKKRARKELHRFRWGFVPNWSKEDNLGKGLINARSETIDQKPTFKESFATRRCLIPASGFYEWNPGSKTPYFVKPKTGIFAFAGIWDRWRTADGKLLISTAIITCPAPEKLEDIHPRVPVSLKRELWNNWLIPGSIAPALKPYLHAFKTNEVDFYPVSKSVNSGSAQGSFDAI